MLVIRLARAGSKKRPYYHITVAESSVARDGRFVERLGFYNPVARGATEGLRLDVERFDHWVRQGAQASDRVKQLVRVARKDGGTPAAAPAEAKSESEEAAA